MHFIFAILLKELSGLRFLVKIVKSNAIKLQCRELHMISKHFKNVSEYGKCRFLGLKRPQRLVKIEIEHRLLIGGAKLKTTQ
jgi:hypothetical protein